MTGREPEVGRAEEAGIEYDLEVMEPGLAIDQDHVQGNSKLELLEPATQWVAQMQQAERPSLRR